MMRRALFLAAFPAVAAAQGTQQCTWSAQRQTNVQVPSGQYNTFFGGNVVMRCPAKELTLRSDSLESYGDEGRVFVLGNVHYTEPRLDVDSDFLTYYQRDERIVATGNVFARLPNGSTMRGPVAEYLRAVPGTRPEPRLLATGRPGITVVQRDSVGQPTEPLIVIAQRVLMLGDSVVFASGDVQATRAEIEARGDSMMLNSAAEFMVMLRQPVIEGRGERPFTLRGERIELTSSNRKLERVLAQGRGRAESQDMTLTADTIDLRVVDDLLSRAIAWGPSRARAASPTQIIAADSIDVSMPAQRIREMYAVRGAAAEGKPDTTRFRADTVDWLRGDTIIARFDTATAADTTDAARIRELVALGGARSYYHMAPSDTAERRPAINYVRGREIVIAFQDQAVSRVTVIEQASGVYLEPRPVANGAPAPAPATPPVTPPATPPRPAP